MKRMTWLMAIAASVALGHTAAGPDWTAHGQFRHLVLAPAVADNLALLFDQFETELVLCLEGERRGADLYISDFRMPHILVSETGRVQASSCRGSSKVVGTWHNHPSPRLGLVSANPEAQSRNCYLSRTDINDFRRRANAEVTVVSCAPHTYAYWRRRDLDAAEADVALLPPPAGQLVRSEIGDPRWASDLTQARGQ